MLAGCSSSGVLSVPPNQIIVTNLTFFAAQPVTGSSPLMQAEVLTSGQTANVNVLGLRDGNGLPVSIQEITMQFPADPSQDSDEILDAGGHVISYTFDSGNARMAFSYPSAALNVISLFDATTNASIAFCEAVTGNQPTRVLAPSDPNCAAYIPVAGAGTAEHATATALGAGRRTSDATSQQQNALAGLLSPIPSQMTLLVGSSNAELTSILSGMKAVASSETTSPVQALRLQAILARFTSRMDEDSSIIEALSQVTQNAAKNSS